MNQIKNVIAIASGKGGVGKTTVAVNVAIALTDMGAEVGLLDADVYGPCVPAMTGQIGQHPRGADNERIKPLDSYGVKLMSMGFLVEETDALAFRGPAAHQLVQEFVRDVEWGRLDYLIIDLPPGTGDVVLTLLQTLQLSGVAIVSTPQNVAMASVVRCIALFRDKQVPILGLVENMSESVCPHCGGDLSIFGSGERVREMGDYWGIPLLGRVPLDPVLRRCADAGEPVVVAEPSSAAACALKQVAENLRLRFLHSPGAPLSDLRVSCLYSDSPGED